MALEKEVVYTIKHVNERLLEDKDFASYFTDEKAVLISEKVFPQTYSRIENMFGNKQGITYTMVTYADDSLKCELFRKNYSFVPDLENPDTPNFYVQSYNNAKEQSEFANALDR